MKMYLNRAVENFAQNNVTISPKTIKAIVLPKKGSLQ